MRDELECGCRVKTQPRIGTLKSTLTTQPSKGEQTGSCVRQVAQAMEEQVKEDQQELETREKKRKAEQRLESRAK